MISGVPAIVSTKKKKGTKALKENVSMCQDLRLLSIGVQNLGVYFCKRIQRLCKCLANIGCNRMLEACINVRKLYIMFMEVFVELHVCTSYFIFHV